MKRREGCWGAFPDPVPLQLLARKVHTLQRSLALVDLCLVQSLLVVPAPVDDNGKPRSSPNVSVRPFGGTGALSGAGASLPLPEDFVASATSVPHVKKWGPATASSKSRRRCAALPRPHGKAAERLPSAAPGRFSVDDMSRGPSSRGRQLPRRRRGTCSWLGRAHTYVCLSIPKKKVRRICIQPRPFRGQSWVRSFLLGEASYVFTRWIKG